MDPSYLSSHLKLKYALLETCRNQSSDVIIKYNEERKKVLNELTSRVHDYLLGKMMTSFSIADYSNLKSAYNEAVNQIKREQCTNDGSYQFFGGQKWGDSSISALPKEIVFHILDLKSCSHILDIEPSILSLGSFIKGYNNAIMTKTEINIVPPLPVNNFCSII